MWPKLSLLFYCGNSTGEGLITESRSESAAFAERTTCLVHLHWKEKGKSEKKIEKRGGERGERERERERQRQRGREWVREREREREKERQAGGEIERGCITLGQNNGSNLNRYSWFLTRTTVSQIALVSLNRRLPRSCTDLFPVHIGRLA